MIDVNRIQINPKTFNVDNAIILRDYIQANPDKFDMHTWWEKDHKVYKLCESAQSCGTVGCLAGTMVFLKTKRTPREYAIKTIKVQAQQILGVDDSLFFVDQWDDDLWKRYKKIDIHTNSVKKYRKMQKEIADLAVEQLDRLIAQVK